MSDRPVNTYDLEPGVRSGLASPALLVFIEIVRANVARTLDLVGGDPDRWRPHLKTVKIPSVMAELTDAGLRHFKCATVREASCLLDHAATRSVGGIDLLLAHHLAGPARARLSVLAEQNPDARVSMLCEDPDDLEEIPDTLGVYLDVNVGMNRTGIAVDRTHDIATFVARAGSRFRGVHAYEGHVAGSDRATREVMAAATYDRIVTLLDSLRARGLPVPELVTSGTPSFLHALAHPTFRDLPGTRHRVSPGTVVFHDARSEEQAPELGLRPAALVLTRVVSHPADGIVTCDAGSKSVAADAGDPVAIVLDHPELETLHPSEEHLPLRVLRGPPPSRGTPLLLVPRHVCPTVNLAECAVIVAGGRIREIAPVAARAHDV